MVPYMESGYFAMMEELEKIQRTLMQRIDEVRVYGAHGNRRELRTSRAALKAINELLADMKLSDHSAA